MLEPLALRMGAGQQRAAGAGSGSPTRHHAEHSGPLGLFQCNYWNVISGISSLAPQLCKAGKQVVVSLC